MTLKTDPFATLADFTPKQPPTAAFAPPPEQVSSLAEKHGFSINNLEEKPRPFESRRVSRAPKTLAKTIRLRVADWNKFVKFCMDNNCTAAEGFSLLTASLPPDN
jgi:hypothetical protein